VGSSEIADNAVGSGEVADNSLTGADINEASLGTVPNADALDGLDSSQFVQNGGIKIAVLKTWHAWPGAVSIDSNFFGFTTFSAAGALANQRLLLIPDIPVTLYGKSLQLTGMEVCYNATDANVVLDEVHLTRDRANNASSTSGAFVVNDTTDRDDNTCRTYTGTPEVLAPNAFATVDLVVDWLAAGSFTVTRTTLFLQPTGSEAPPLPVQGDVHHDISEA
jgi:hypothetical protein